MSLKINLIKNRHTLSEKDYQKERAYFRYSLILSVVITVITVAVSLWQFLLTRELSQIEASITSSTQKLQGLAQANAKQIYLKSRLKLISGFLDDRAVSRQAIQKVFSIQIPDVSISGLTFESDNTLKVQATALNVQAFGQLIEYISKDSGFFLQILSQNVTRNDTGEYVMSMLLTIPKS